MREEETDTAVHAQEPKRSRIDAHVGSVLALGQYPHVPSCAFDGKSATPGAERDRDREGRAVKSVQICPLLGGQAGIDVEKSRMEASNTISLGTGCYVPRRDSSGSPRQRHNRGSDPERVDKTRWSETRPVVKSCDSCTWRRSTWPSDGKTGQIWPKFGADTHGALTCELLVTDLLSADASAVITPPTCEHFVTGI
jgi:hypothetical protein